MSDWKKKIEEQIADLQNSCYLLDEYGAEIGVSEHAASMQALFEVAVAAHNHRLYLELSGKQVPKRLEHALDKLREASDE